MKEEYIEKITTLLNDCNDISLLDFVFQLLNESGQHLPESI